MSQDNYRAFQGIVSEIERLCGERRTGVLYIATKANRSAQLMLDKGEIVYINFFNKRGEEAIALMATIVAGRFCFKEDAIFGKPMVLPSTSDILQLLAAKGADSRLSVGKQPLQEVRPTREVRAAAALLTEEQRNLLEETLAAFIDPMAAIICGDHLDTAKTFQDAVEALAGEILHKQQGDNFRSEILRKMS